MSKKIPPHNPLEGNKPELVIDLHDEAQEQVSVIIVHKDRPEYLNICVQTISVCSGNDNCEIIVVDSGSTSDQAKEFLDDLEKNGIKIVRLPKNVYFSQAANQGVAAASKNSKYLIFMHCDVNILSPGWITQMVRVSQSQKSGLVGVSSGEYQLGERKISFAEEWLLLMTRECFDTIGPWPEELPALGNGFLMTIKAQVFDFRPQIMQVKLAHHYKVFSFDPSEWEQIMENAMGALPKLVHEVQSKPVNAL